MIARQPSENFLVAFSLAGEQRELVRAIAEAVERELGDNTVFLDEWFQHWLPGDADLKLQKVYGKGCSLAVVCVSERYGEKPWTLAEHAAIRSRAMLARTSPDPCDRFGVFPIRVGDGDVEGILFNDIVPDVRPHVRTTAQAAELIIERLRLIIPDLRTKSGSAPAVPSWPAAAEPARPHRECSSSAHPEDYYASAATLAEQEDTRPAKGLGRQNPELFISYAWGDSTIEGRRRDAVVDAICATLRDKKIVFRRDKADIKSGDRIKEFMDRLIEGDLIVVILSDKYLRSSFCMYELYGIYDRFRHRADGFLEHVIPLFLPDAQISKPVDRLKYAAYWKQQCDELRDAVHSLGDVAYAGVEIIKEYRLVGEFATHVADMLTFLNDRMVPRDLDNMNRGGFMEVLNLIIERLRLVIPNLKKKSGGAPVVPSWPATSQQLTSLPMAVIAVDNRITFSIGANWTFRATAEKLAESDQKVVVFEGFSDGELRMPMKSQPLSSAGVKAALANLRDAVNSSQFPQYTVEEQESRYIMRRISQKGEDT